MSGKLRNKIFKLPDPYDALARGSAGGFDDVLYVQNDSSVKLQELISFYHPIMY
jgi:hypothetical protein